jgi:hypothetical protein
MDVVGGGAANAVGLDAVVVLSVGLRATNRPPGPRRVCLFAAGGCMDYAENAGVRCRRPDCYQRLVFRPSAWAADLQQRTARQQQQLGSRIALSSPDGDARSKPETSKMHVEVQYKV